MSGASVQLALLESVHAPAARSLVWSEIWGTPYTELPMSALDRALEGESAEARGIVAVLRADVVGVALYGSVAGTAATGKLHLIAVTAAARLQGVGLQLCEAAIQSLRAVGARLVVAEVPGDPALKPGLAMLERCGFAEEARVANYYRDGVALLLLRLDLPI